MTTRTPILVSCLMLSGIFRHRRTRLWLGVLWCLGLWVFAPAAPAAELIPEARITALQAELAQGMRGTSMVEVRRACKSVARQASALLEASPEAPNQYAVLAVLFQSQKRLIALENTERTRALLFETCNRLLKAPDEYAELRLEADLLLSDQVSAERGATRQERVEALAELVARYRDTPAEIKSLMMAARIAPRLEVFSLEHKLLGDLSERFPGNLRVMEFLRKRLSASTLDALFAGTYSSADGRVLSFPVDRLGHSSLLLFWSGKTPDIEQWLDGIKDVQSRFPGRFDVFSFNLDDLDDGAAATLRKRGLDWTALRVPGGRKSQVYRIYAGKDPLVMRVNPHGHTFLYPTLAQSRAPDRSVESALALLQTTMEENLDDARYLAQLQSLLVGDFLVTQPAAGLKRQGKSVPIEVLAPIQSCFVAPPFRYRLTTQEALANYRKAEDLCRQAIARYPDAPDLSLVRHRRIIALLGLWKLTCEPVHLERAVEEAQACLAVAPPPKHRVVPEFCLAKEALRRADSNSQNVLSAYIDATGGDAAPASALAAAAILTLDAGRRDLHAVYRGMVLGLRHDDPTLWPVVSFLRDPHHTYRLFKAHYYYPPSMERRRERGRLRRYTVAWDVPADKSGPLKAEFKTLDGGALSLPGDTVGALTILVFVEPPADPGADFSVFINGAVTEDAKGNKREVHGIMQRVFQLAEKNEDIGLVAVFLSEDPERIKALMKNPHPWPCQVVMAPGGLRHPLVRRLGVLSPDRVPNMVLLNRDGTIAWTQSGIVHPQHRCEVGELPHSIIKALEVNIRLCRMKDAEVNEGQKTPR
ncbi:MAG: hypothetical protein HN700_10155 [Verrucomicrobia bacterium]|nr:hypothetical protein [Verrucomicrobiota bacterium]